ncbi:Cytochrome c oxidase assembly protein PET191 family-containing protein [Strongyloides ratti]|uniref:Cytochrome c oxidase assembly factor 5 n=1 Tax=Strongyloides ratti TaxID=34506 RepID=A0A090MX71_STRRB|nr:Cytochrome c oxidase assembly protein PET191 family-containing protein [Strongyloides ratti]CEF64924.1 Cytochrome c oxidase assembly protein PET191 family-containing protein [Strongyloides ratti]
MASLHSNVRQEFADSNVALQPSSGRSCDKIRQELKRCIKESSCVQVEGRKAKDCLNSRDGGVPDRCYVLLSSFTDCKKSLVDMRSRFRGRKGDM